MNSVFEKIIEKLEERTSFLSDCTKYGNKDAEQQNKSYSTIMMYEVADLVDDLIDIVEQVADEYNNGWIPCSERLPEEPEEGLTDLDECDEYIVMIEDADIPTALNYVGDGEWYRDGNYYKVNAWQPLPDPYHPKGE